MTFKIKLLTNKNVPELFRFINEQDIISTDRNKVWFAPLKLKYTDYDLFTLLYKDDLLVGFSAIQSFNFPDHICRVLSRTYFDKSIRRNDISFTSAVRSPAMYMLETQLENLQNTDKEFIIISMEYLKRRVHLTRFMDWVNDYYGLNFVLSPYMHKTCPDAEFSGCWQSIIYLSKSGKELDLDKMTIDEWNRKFKS